MLWLKAKFRVRPDAVHEARQLIEQFTSAVELHEPGCLQYDSWHDTQHGTFFQHTMCFDSQESRVLHREAPYTRAFVEALTPLCERMPTFEEQALVAGFSRIRAHPILSSQE